MSMTDLNYLLDGDPISALDLIDRARKLSPKFNASSFYTTSEAAAILRRENGSEVRTNNSQKERAK